MKRRDMLRAGAAGAGLVVLRSGMLLGKDAPSNKLNVACIGVGGRGGAQVGGVRSETIVAMCDVDEKRAGKRFAEFDKVGKFHDFRRMFDAMEKQIDAVTVSTPDHTHFHPSMWALQRGKHLYCEKPMAHNVWECRQMTTLARKKGLATQLGVQRHTKGNIHRVVELVRGGAIGKVKEVHSWVGGSRGMPGEPKGFPPVPDHLKWDLWLGPAEDRKYSPAYCPYKWRFWWDFGTGETGNWGCHMLDVPYWALNLKYPKRVDLDEVPAAADIDPRRTPKSMQTRLDFPAEEGHGELSLHWWHGGPSNEIFEKHGAKEDMVLFLGETGTISAGFNNHTTRMFDASQPKAPPETIAPSPGFHREWINACKGGPRASCDFVDYTGPLAEAVLLANAAFRAGGGFDWNAKEFKASGNPKADDHIFPDYREGWKVGTSHRNS